jgi:hypothetical protein
VRIACARRSDNLLRMAWIAVHVHRSHTRVCPDCGSKAGAELLCRNCGLNLGGLKRLPTREDWEATHRRELGQTEQGRRGKLLLWIQRHRWPVASAGAGALAAVGVLGLLLPGAAG